MSWGGGQQPQNHQAYDPYSGTYTQAGWQQQQPGQAWQQASAEQWNHQQGAETWQYQQPAQPAPASQWHQAPQTYDPNWNQAQPSVSPWDQNQPSAQTDWHSAQANTWVPPPPAPVLPPPDNPPPPPVPLPAPVAYTSVAPKAPPPIKAKAAWPETLRKYVERAFAQPLADKAGMQTELTKIISTAQAKGDLWTRDWDNHPLPLSNQTPNPALATGKGVAFSLKAAAQPRSVTLSTRGQEKRKRSPSSSPSPPPLPQAKLSKKQKQALQAEQRSLQHLPAAERKQARRELHREAVARAALEQTKRAQIIGQSPVLNSAMQKKGKNKLVLVNKQDTGKPDWSSQIEADPLKQNDRARRFGDGSAVGAVQWHQQERNLQADWTRYDMAVEAEDVVKNGPAIIGTCQDIEKSYFRLTSKPDPRTVRPEPVLRAALNRLVERIRLGDRRCSYIYASDQLKGMRQDCTVQHMRNELSAKVYETHARCALENGDIGEFNQCQSQLQEHYAAGVPGCHHEFLAYRILYQAVHAGKGQKLSLLTCLQSIPPEARDHELVKQAMQVRQAIGVSDCFSIMSLYPKIANMGQALLDVIVPKVKFTGLKTLLKAHQPNLPVGVVARRLGFTSKDPEGNTSTKIVLPGASVADFRGHHYPGADNAGAVQCLDWLKSCGAVLVPAPGDQGGLVVDTKASLSVVHMPVEIKPVGPDLDINDFLSRIL